MMMSNARKSFSVMMMIFFMGTTLSSRLWADEATNETASKEEGKVESRKEAASLQNQPRLSFDTTNYDAGEIWEDEEVSHTFTVSNLGTSYLEIVVKPG